MKVWQLKIGTKVYRCSLLSMDSHLSMATVRTGERNVLVQFNHRFDFARAKSGDMVECKTKWEHGKYNKSGTITFK